MAIKAASLIVMAMIFGCHVINAQVYTPQGEEVKTASFRYDIMTEANKQAYIDYVRSKYPKASIVGEPDHAYNCHAYAWHVSEGGYKIWINYTDVYWKDGSYVAVSVGDSKASKVSYGEKGDHSAVVASGNYLISKWGSGCLVKHLPKDCPYNTSQMTYYKLNMEISGETIMVLPSAAGRVTKEYTLSNVPKGATVEWIINDPRSEIQSGQGSNRVSIAVGGDLFIEAKIHPNNGSHPIRIPGISVRASYAPIVTDIEMLLYGQEEGEYIFKAVTNQPTAPCIWNVACNTWNNKAVIHELPYPDDAIFLQYPNLFTAIDFYGIGNYTVSVTAIAADGLNRNTFSKDFDITTSKPALPYPLSQKQKK